MNSWEDFERTVWAYGFVVVIAALAIAALNRNRRERLFTMQRLRPGEWTGRTVIGHFFLSLLCAILALRLLTGLQIYERLLPETENIDRRMNLASPLAFVVFFAISITSLYVLNRTSVARVGLSFFRWRPNAILGASAFIVVTPIVLGTYAACLQFYDAEPHSIEALARELREDYEWIILFLQTVVFAPIAEEWLFRGLLQGWLRRTNLLGHAMLLWISIGVLSMHLYSESVTDKADQRQADKKKVDEVKKNAEAEWFLSNKAAPLCFALLIGAGYAGAVVWLYRPVLKRGLAYFMGENRRDLVKPSPDLWTSNLFEAEGQENRTMPWDEFGPKWSQWKDWNARLAIVGSSLAFALLHFAWPSAVPLFVFGHVLGWLAYRTQNLIPSMVLHALFNFVSFLVLWFSVQPGIIGSEDNVARATPIGVEIVKIVPGVWWPR